MKRNLLYLILILGALTCWPSDNQQFIDKWGLEICPTVLSNSSSAIYNPYNVVIKDVPIETPTVVNYWEQTPYNTFPEYVAYFKERAKTFESEHGVPYEMILSKAWTETHAGKTGAGVRTAIFGIKGKGVKGYDKKEAQNVEYNGYKFRWQAYSDFCKFVKKPFYVERFNAWKKVNPKKPDYYNYNLALQAHPNPKLGRMAYASCGCKSGLIKSCRTLRLEHAYKNITLIEKYIK